jgi:hypothetical protein
MHPHMPFSVSWHTLLDEAEELLLDTTLITDTREHRVISKYRESGNSRSNSGEEGFPGDRETDQSRRSSDP